MSKILGPLFCLWLTSCGGPSSPATALPPTIADVTTFLNRMVSASTGLPCVLTNCADPTPQVGVTPFYFYAQDWSRLPNVQVEQVFRADSGAYWVNSYQFPPYAVPFSPSLSEGGDVFETDGVVVRATFTQNGNNPNYWCGPPDQGWFEFKNDATANWQGVVSQLGSSQTGSGPCPPYNAAYSQYLMTPGTVTFRYNGALVYVNGRLVVTQHFDHPTLATSVYMEQIVWLEGYGRVEWSAYQSAAGTNPVFTPACADAAPGVTPAGWTLYDRRCPTSIAAGNTSATGDLLAWPAANFKP